MSTSQGSPNDKRRLRVSIGNKTDLRADFPDTVEFIETVIKVFGTPAAVEVRDSAGRVIFRAGKFDGE